MTVPVRKKTGGKLPGAGRPKGRKNNATLVKEALAGDFVYMLKHNFKDVFKAVVREAKEGNMVAAKLLMDKVIPNASDGVAPKVGDLGINITISDMKAVEIESIEGEVIENDQ